MNTNSNTYTIAYASIMVVVVAFLLAFVSSSLKPTQEKNVELDKKKQILSALNIRHLESNDAVEAKYNEVVLADMIINAEGKVLNEGTEKDKAGFTVANKDVTPENMPIYRCAVEGDTLYVVPMTGRGLWGGLWGYVAVKNTKEATVYGAYFSHESETAGLGALIAEEKFQDSFKDKKLYADSTSQKVDLTVVKNGKVEERKKHIQVNGITGATLTSNGVADMVTTGLQAYDKFLRANR